MTKHFSFSTDLIFVSFFRFLFLFNVFLIHLLFRKKFPDRIVGKKISPGRSDGNKQFFFFGLVNAFSNSLSPQNYPKRVYTKKYVKRLLKVSDSFKSISKATIADFKWGPKFCYCKLKFCLIFVYFKKLFYV